MLEADILAKSEWILKNYSKNGHEVRPDTQKILKKWSSTIFWLYFDYILTIFDPSARISKGVRRPKAAATLSKLPHWDQK